MSSMEEGRRNCVIAKVELGNLHRIMDSIIAVRTSAYEQWNGPKSAEQRREEATDWIGKIQERRNSVVYLVAPPGLIFRNLNLSTGRAAFLGLARTCVMIPGY